MSNAVLKGNASGTGTVTLETPNTNTDRTISIPDATGTVMVSGNMPAFSAYAGTTTSVADTTYTKITYDTEDFDTNSNFSSSRFTPTVAGYYQINATTRSGSGITATIPFLSIWKNGSIYQRGGGGGVVSGYSFPTISGIVYCNGTTDYIEIYLYQNSGLTISTDSGSTYKFTGSMVRSA